jgi:hypothetical protein
MARASYQQLPNIVLGQPRPRKIVKAASFSPSSFSPPSPVVPRKERPKKPVLKLKFPSSLHSQ